MSLPEPYYQRGPVTIYRGDCLELLPELPRVDAVVTSPPYNCGKQYGECEDSLELSEYWQWLESVLHSSASRLHDWGYLCVNHANYIGSREHRVYVPDELSAILSRCAPFVDLIIWDKGPASGAAWGNFRTSPRIRANHENIFVHGGSAQMPESDIEWSEWAQFTQSVWRIPTAGVDLSVHPAMMPVEVVRRLSLLYSPASGTILDPFLGSGTTAVAAIRTGRQCIGIELEERYCEIAARRCDRELDQGRLPFDDPPKLVKSQRELFADTAANAG